MTSAPVGLAAACRPRLPALPIGPVARRSPPWWWPTTAHRWLPEAAGRARRPRPGRPTSWSPPTPAAPTTSPDLLATGSAASGSSPCPSAPASATPSRGPHRLRRRRPRPPSSRRAGAGRLGLAAARRLRPRARRPGAAARRGGARPADRGRRAQGARPGRPPAAARGRRHHRPQRPPRDAAGAPGAGPGPARRRPARCWRSAPPGCWCAATSGTSSAASTRRLPLLRDDVDLGWRANLAGHRVVVRHRRGRAPRRGGQPPPPAGARRRRAAAPARPAARAVRAAGQPAAAASAGRAGLADPRRRCCGSLGLLAGKLPGHAADETLALLAVLGRPDRLVAARLDRRRTRRVPARSALPLLAPRGAGVRHGDGDPQPAPRHPGRRRGRRAAPRRPARHLGRPRPARPRPRRPRTCRRGGGGLLRRLRPAAVGAASRSPLVLLALLAARGLLGDGRLMGGALLPAPDVGERPVAHATSGLAPGRGRAATRRPRRTSRCSAALARLLLGGAERAVDLLLLAAVPLAGLTAYLAAAPGGALGAAAGLGGRRRTRCCPPVLGAVAAGRLGHRRRSPSCCRSLVLAVPRALGARRHRPASWRGRLGRTRPAARGDGRVRPDDRGPGGRCSASSALVRTCAAATWSGSRCLVLVPPVLLLPWLPAVVADPQLLLLEAGCPGRACPTRPRRRWTCCCCDPGGPGLPPLVLGGGRAARGAGRACCGRTGAGRCCSAGWSRWSGWPPRVVVSRVDVTAPTLETPVPAWPGAAMLLAGAGLLARGGRRRRRAPASG